MTKIESTDFLFKFTGYGRYEVTYRSPVTGKKWTATVEDMTLIDATKNAEYPLKKDLNELKRVVKNK